MLGQHPGIYMSTPKEIHFYSYEDNFVKGQEWYDVFFHKIGNFRCVGEGSTSYTDRDSYPNTAKRIARTHPNAKLIYIVRHPLERMVSAWRMMAVDKRGRVKPFDEMLKDHPAIVSKSKYWYQVSAYRELIPDSNIRVLFFEDFKREPHATVKYCFNFLGVDSSARVESIRTNEAKERYVPGRFLGELRNFGLGVRFKDFMPKVLRRSLRKAFERPGPEAPVWTPEIKKWATNQILGDSQEFLKFFGKPESFWNMDFDQKEERILQRRTGYV